MITGDKPAAVPNASLQTLPAEQSLTKTAVRVTEIKPAYDAVNEKDINEGQNKLQEREVQRLPVDASETINKISQRSSTAISRHSQVSSTHVLHSNTIPSHLKKTLEIRDVEQERWIALGEARDKIMEECNPSDIIKAYAIDPSTAEGQKILREFVLEYARKNHYKRISQNIHLFCIDKESPEGQNVLFEIALRVADEYDSHISECIQNYGIDPTKPEGQKKLIQLAKLAAKKDEYFPKYIQNYRIDTSHPEGRAIFIEIAKMAYTHVVTRLSEFVQNFGFDPNDPAGRQILFEIAKIAAEHDKNISEFIKNYGFDSTTPKGKSA